MINGLSGHNSVSNKGNTGDSLISSLYNHFSCSQRQACLKEKKRFVASCQFIKGLIHIKLKLNWVLLKKEKIRFQILPSYAQQQLSTKMCMYRNAFASPKNFRDETIYWSSLLTLMPNKRFCQWSWLILGLKLETHKSQHGNWCYNSHCAGGFGSPYHDVTMATVLCVVLYCPKSDPYILSILQRLLLSLVFIWKVQSTLVDLWLLKRRVYCVPAS